MTTTVQPEHDPLMFWKTCPDILCSGRNIVIAGKKEHASRIAEEILQNLPAKTKIIIIQNRSIITLPMKIRDGLYLWTSLESKPDHIRQEKTESIISSIRPDITVFAETSEKTLRNTLKTGKLADVGIMTLISEDFLNHQSEHFRLPEWTVLRTGQ